jgi:hypothetical protein
MMARLKGTKVKTNAEASSMNLAQMFLTGMTVMNLHMTALGTRRIYMLVPSMEMTMKTQGTRRIVHAVVVVAGESTIQRMMLKFYLICAPFNMLMVQLALETNLVNTGRSLAAERPTHPMLPHALMVLSVHCFLRTHARM